MNTIHLTISLTIPQLAELLRTQLSSDERQQLAALMLEQKPKAKKPKKELPSVREDVLAALQEVKLYQQGKIQLPTMQDFLDEL